MIDLSSGRGTFTSNRNIRKKRFESFFTFCVKEPRNSKLSFRNVKSKVEIVFRIGFFQGSKVNQFWSEVKNVRVQ